jgi:hypothetical protein
LNLFGAKIGFSTYSSIGFYSAFFYTLGMGRGFSMVYLGDSSVFPAYSGLFRLNFIILGAKLGTSSFLSPYFLGYIFSTFSTLGYSLTF